MGMQRKQSVKAITYPSFTVANCDSVPSRFGQSSEIGELAESPKTLLEDMRVHGKRMHKETDFLLEDHEKSALDTRLAVIYRNFPSF